MSRLKRFDLMESPSSYPIFYRETSHFLSPLFDIDDQLGFAPDFPNPNTDPFDLPLQSLIPYPPPLSPLDFFDNAADLIQISPNARNLSDRVTALELGLDRAPKSPNIRDLDRKYTWTAEIKGKKDREFDRKYKLTAERKGAGGKSFIWTAEMKGKGDPVSCTYSFQASMAPAVEKAKKSEDAARVVEIEGGPEDRRAVAPAIFKRASYHSKGKRKELPPQDAALIIQMSFRAHLVRRSQVLGDLRDLAVAKTKLKEIRALFCNFSYRHHIINNAEEQRRFSEKIMALLMTVDAIKGFDYMVRSTKRSIVEKLEAMLETLNPQLLGKLDWLNR